MSYDKIPENATLKPQKFELKIPQAQIDRFYQLLGLSQLAPKTYENTRTDPNEFGVNHDFMSKAKKYWENPQTYDWYDAFLFEILIIETK